MNPTFRFCLFTVSLFLIHFGLQAQLPQVPLEMQFADLTLRIHPQAQREIQLDVDALYRNQTYFNLKADRFNLYLPILERELRNQGVPDEIKYLVIQESGLVPDAVSTSNAVGFWQFKQGTAEEVGLRVDSQIDERKNIAKATRGAAIYLKKHQKILNNWMAALVSYQMGLGGAKAYFGNQYAGQKLVVVDRNTHWYFKKFLAHKVAFEAARISLTSTTPRLTEVQIQGPTTFTSLSKRFGVPEAQLIEFNKWAVNGRIPTGSHTLFLLKGTGLLEGPVPSQNQPRQATASSKNTPTYKPKNSFPKISGNTTKATEPNQILVNNLEGVQASSQLPASEFSEEIGIRQKRFLKFNDLQESEVVQEGGYYYTEKKRPRAAVATHIVETGETLWSISQKYGIRLASLKSKNRIRKEADLRPGMILNLKESRKRGEAIPQYMEPIPTTLSPSTTSSPVESIPVGPTEQVPPSTRELVHTVRAGETLFSISKKYGLTVDELKQLNSIGSQNLITVGQKLRILNR